MTYLKVSDIRKLLKEATTALPMRQNEIMVTLSDATYSMHSGIHEVGTPAAGIADFITALYFRVLELNALELPALLPVFVLACGPRDSNEIFGDVI